MKITTITITYGRKINLGNYNNANLEVTLGAELDEGDDHRAAMEHLWEEAKASAKAQVAHLIEQQKTIDARKEDKTLRKDENGVPYTGKAASRALRNSLYEVAEKHHGDDPDFYEIYGDS